MKKVLFVLTALTVSTGFANAKKEERKPANSSTMQCTGYTYAFGNGVGAKVEFAIGFSGSNPVDGFRIDNADALEGRNLSTIDSAILLAREFRVSGKAVKIILEKKAKASWQWNRGEAEINSFSMIVDGKVDGAGVCDRYNH